MRSTTFTSVAAAILLAACQGAGGFEASPQAAAIAASLRAQDGVGEVIVEPGAAGERVIVSIDVPVAAAGLDDAARAGVSDAILSTFTASTCREAELTTFFDGGGELLIETRGSDGGTVASVPITACA